MSQTQVLSFKDESSKTSDEALQKLALKAHELELCTDAELLLHDLKKRESQGTTALVEGVSLPHAKSQAVEAPSVLIGRFAHPVSWMASNQEVNEVHVAIALLMPEGIEGMKHLKNLSKIAYFLSNDENVSNLLEEDDLDILVQKIENVLNN